MIQFSYEDILERLRNNLQKRLENTGMLFYSSNQRILEAIAEELQEQMRYDEYLLQESKWNLAQNPTSIMHQAQFFNYVPHRKIGATGNVEVSSSENFNGTYPRSIFIPKFTQFSSGDLTFCAMESSSLLTNQESIYVPIVQGEYREITQQITSAYTEADLLDFELPIENDSIENFLYDVRVNGEVWAEIKNFSESPSEDAQVYQLENLADYSGVILRFGDGVYAKKLAYGDIIEFRYIETEGIEGEVLQTNVINEVLSPIFDGAGRRVELFCRNTDRITGGSNYETLSSIRENAPRSLGISSRIITKEDYEAFTLDTGIADKVIVWGESEFNLDNNEPPGTYIPPMENVIKISAINYSNGTGLPLTDAQEMNIREEMASIKSLTDIIQFVKPKITFLNFFVTAFYDSNISTSSQVIEAVSDLLRQNFDIQQVDFMQNLYFSQYYELINSLPEVKYHKTDLYLSQIISDVSFNEAEEYVFEINTLHKFIHPETVSLYVRNISADHEDHSHGEWFKIGEDDGEGDFVGELVPEDFSPDPGETYNITFITPGSEIQYDQGLYGTGDGTVTSIKITNGMILNEPENYEIKIIFQTGQNQSIDAVPTQRYQIFSVDEIEVIADMG